MNNSTVDALVLAVNKTAPLSWTSFEGQAKQGLPLLLHSERRLQFFLFRHSDRHLVVSYPLVGAAYLQEGDETDRRVVYDKATRLVPFGRCCVG